MRYLAALSPVLAVLAISALSSVVHATVTPQAVPVAQRTEHPAPVHPPEWLSALPAPVGPAAHAAGLPMPDELLLAFAGLGVAAVGWRLRRRS